MLYDEYYGVVCAFGILERRHCVEKRRAQWPFKNEAHRPPQIILGGEALIMERCHLSGCLLTEGLTRFRAAAFFQGSADTEVEICTSWSGLGGTMRMFCGFKSLCTN